MVINFVTALQLVLYRLSHILENFECRKKKFEMQIIYTESHKQRRDCILIHGGDNRVPRVRHDERVAICRSRHIYRWYLFRPRVIRN